MADLYGSLNWFKNNINCVFENFWCKTLIQLYEKLEILTPYYVIVAKSNLFWRKVGKIQINFNIIEMSVKVVFIANQFGWGRGGWRMKELVLYLKEIYPDVDIIENSFASIKKMKFIEIAVI